MKIEIPWYWLLRPWVVCGMRGTARVQPMNSQDLVYHPLKGLNIGEHLENDAYRWHNAATLLMSVGPETREVVRTLLGKTWAYGNLGTDKSWPPTDAEMKDTYAPTCWPRDWGFERMELAACSGSEWFPRK